MKKIELTKKQFETLVSLVEIKMSKESVPNDVLLNIHKKLQYIKNKKTYKPRKVKWSSKNCY